MKTAAELEARCVALTCWLREVACVADGLPDCWLAAMPAQVAYLSELPGALLELVDALYRARARQRKLRAKAQRRR